MYSNVIQKQWVVKSPDVPPKKKTKNVFLPFWAFKEVEIFDMHEVGCLLSLFVCLRRVTLCRQGEDSTEEASFCQPVDGGSILDLALTCLRDNVVWQLWHSIDKHLQKSRQYNRSKRKGKEKKQNNIGMPFCCQMYTRLMVEVNFAVFSF